MGLALVALAVLDALWTTLWLEGRAGPLAGRLAEGLHRAFTRTATRRDAVDHRLLSIQGPVILTAGLLLWVLLLWAGWATAFCASRGALVDPHTQAPAGIVDRIYFTAYTMFTIGNGDFVPRGAGWKLATSLTGMSGLLLVTLAVTYLLAVIEAVVGKRSFASQVFALGATAEDFVVHAWDGEGFRGLDLQLLSLVEQLNLVTEQHRAYPMLHYFHAEHDENAPVLAVAILDDALTTLTAAVDGRRRPSPSAMHVARESVRMYLDAARGARVCPAPHALPAPDLARLRAAGIPVAGDDALADALAGLDERRRMLQGLLDRDCRNWPPRAPTPAG